MRAINHDIDWVSAKIESHCRFLASAENTDNRDMADHIERELEALTSILKRLVMTPSEEDTCDQ